MAADDFLAWLTDIDLEEYEPALRGLGVKTAKHLADCNVDHLKKIEVLELEIKRCLKKITESFQADATSNIPEVSAACRVQKEKRINVPLQSATDISKLSLHEKYSDLWYTEPHNYK